MRHTELTPAVIDKVKAWQSSGYCMSAASMALELSIPKIKLAAPGYWGRRQLSKGLLRRLTGNYFVPPLLQGLHTLFKRYVDKEPQIELELLLRLLGVDGQQFTVVGRWLVFEQDRVKARRYLAGIAWRVWESYRDCGKERPGSPPQLVGSRWFEKHPEWKVANQVKLVTKAPAIKIKAPIAEEQATRDRIAGDQRRRNRELADLLWVTRCEWSNS